MLLMACMTMAIAAQDVIVKKDGSTILSKVIEISDTQVKYKKHSNIDGPTYVVNVSELAGINYQNGEKESFDAGISTTSEAEALTPASPAYGFTNTQQSGSVSDSELIRAYKKSQKGIHKIKRLKRWGYTMGSMLLTAGTIMFLAGEDNLEFGIGIGLMCAGGIVGGACVGAAHHKQKIYNRLQSASLFQQEIPLASRTRLTADVNLLKDDFSKQQSVGIGFHLNF